MGRRALNELAPSDPPPPDPNDRTARYPHAPVALPIAALEPFDGAGCQFLLYGDCCSGVPGTVHEANFAAVNAVAARLWPPPDFICFLGDELRGLTADHAALRAEWRYWLDHEMVWLDERAIPVYHSTSNHVTYDERSEELFRELLPELPRNGPPDQLGLSYFVRRGDLLLVFINTSTVALGGDGWVETEWLERTLTEHADARHKLVLGHQPVFAPNGLSGPLMREIDLENGQRLWSIFVAHGVLAYLCSHMLCFDVQVQQGVLQVLSAGAGTAHLGPGDYLHLTQCALDQRGFRYQTLDTRGQIMESLRWPWPLPAEREWRDSSSEPPTDFSTAANPGEPRLLVFSLSARQCPTAQARTETLVSAWQDDGRLSLLWIGLAGPRRELTVILTPVEGRSPQIWRGPALLEMDELSVQVAIHKDMGPGGILWRPSAASAWTSLRGSSNWGPERLPSPLRYSIGCDRGDTTAKPFRGSRLQVSWCAV